MQPDYGDVVRYDTLPKLLLHNAGRWPAEVAMREKEFGIWNEFTWADCRERVKTIALGLLALGVKRGEVVSYIGKNRPEMVWSELAIHSVGCMSLGVYQDAMPQEVSYLVDYAEVRVVLAEDEEQVDKLLEVAERSKSIEKIVYFDSRGMRKYRDSRLVSWDELKALAAALEAKEPARFADEVAAGSGEDVAILCTTSGTTANPKLAMLQAGPFLGHCAAYLEVDPKRPTDNYVSVLPLPWIMEQIYGVAQPLISRITVNFVEGPETMMADLREIGPTFVLLAPRVWEQIAADVRSSLRNIQSAIDSHRIESVAVELAEQRVDATTELYAAGRVQALDKLDAQDSLLSARLNLTAAIVDYHVAKRKGHKVACVFPDQEEGGLGTMLIPNAVGLVAGGPDQDGGKRLIDRIVSKETEALLAAAEGAQIPLRAGVQGPQDPAIKAVGSFREMAWDPAQTATALARCNQEFSKRWGK
jgi:long-subunit acyl-CoA synthetase (AMP-forming)